LAEISSCPKVPISIPAVLIGHHLQKFDFCCTTSNSSFFVSSFPQEKVK
jgi:hypothetical protein